jgi:hypothetical protein
MTRRTEGPKRNAEAYARKVCPDGPMETNHMRAELARAWMAGYRAAARARRIDRPKPRAYVRKGQT